MGILGGNQAAGKDQEAISNAENTVNQFYGNAKTFQQPYYNAGTQQLQNLTNGINNGSFTDREQFNFQQSPEYNFNMQQGQQGIQQQMAGAGGLFSGATMKALAKYGSNMAGQQYQNAFENFQKSRQFNQESLNNQQTREQNVANQGQVAGNNLTSLTQNQGNELAGFQIGSGNVGAQQMMSNTQNTQGLFNNMAKIGASFMGKGSNAGTVPGATQAPTGPKKMLTGRLMRAQSVRHGIKTKELCHRQEHLQIIITLQALPGIRI